MKWLAFFISIYILSLASMPCVDRNNHVCANHSEQTSQNDSPRNSEQSNACSPFCVCACCNVSVIVPYYYTDTDPIAFHKSSYIPIYENITSAYNGSIWQPPKLG